MATTTLPDTRRRRRAMPAGRALGVGLICFGAWLLLDARNLERSARAGALGPRRTLALALLSPLRRVSALVSLDRASILIDEALGRSIKGPVAGGGSVVAITPPVTTTLPAASASPSANVTVPVSVPTPPIQPLPPLRQPTAQDPLRVLIVGDSIAKDFGESLLEQLGATGVVNPILDARPATGLSRPDYFDWQAQLASDLARDRPEVVVAMFGGNDAQPFLLTGHPVHFNTPEWTAAYGARIAQFVGQAAGGGRRVLWVGMPVMSSATFSASMQVLNQIDRTQMNSVVGQAGGFFDSWPLFVDASGHYSAYLADATGRLQQVRQSDGIHLSRAGADRLATAVVADLQSRFGRPFH
jgi:uncharacterized protein